MWSKFKRPIRQVCDPSAGRGHLLRYAKEGFQELSEDQIPWLADVPDESFGHGRYAGRVREYARMKFADLREACVVEIDAQHHASLKEIGLKILGYDFLDVRSLATVSQVIMNPPFSDGAKHVLHAWDVVYDAEIVAIINAESIKNPFSADRQRLVDLIDRHGSVEFLKDQFTDEVERTTTVEVALIHLDKVPGKYLDMDALLQGLKAGDSMLDEIEPETCNALALPSNFITDTVHRFYIAVQAARKASEAMAVAEHLKNGLGLTLEKMQAQGVGSDVREAALSIREKANDDFKKFYEELKQRAWAQIIRSSVLTDKLSNQARRKIEASAANIYDLEFSAANVHGFLVGVIQSMGDIYQEMIVDLFDTIINRSSDNVVFYKAYKSNQKHRIGMRIRKTRFIIPRFHVGYRSGLDYESLQFLSDIDKVFGYLHGITTSYDGLVDGAKNNDIKSAERISTRFFDFRYYVGTGTIHFYPKSDSVVEKINLFVGKVRNWLPGDMEEANADFCKQYDKGEAFTKEYLAQRNKTSCAIGRSNPVYQLLKEVTGCEDGAPELDQLEGAIEAVHAQHGLRCGPSLQGASKQPALTMSSSTAETNNANEQQGSFFL